MTQALCRYCKKIIIEDWEKFLEESKEKFIECPYCGRVMKSEREDYEE